MSQQVVAQVFSVTKSWMKSKKEYEKNPSKFLSRPKLPKYKKGKKQNMVVFTKKFLQTERRWMYSFHQKHNPANQN